MASPSTMMSHSIAASTTHGRDQFPGQCNGKFIDSVESGIGNIDSGDDSDIGVWDALGRQKASKM